MNELMKMKFGKKNSKFELMFVDYLMMNMEVYYVCVESMIYNYYLVLLCCYNYYYYYIDHCLY